MGRRWRFREEEGDTEGEAANAVVFLSSSDGEEANEDLSLAIVSKARFREAKRKRAEDKDRARTFFVDLSTSSADEIEAVPNGNGAGARKEIGPAGAGEEMKKKRKKRPTRKKKKNKSAEEESGPKLPDAPAKEKEATETSDYLIEAVDEASGNIVLRKPAEPPDAPDKEDEPTGAVDSAIEVVNEASSNIVLRKLLRCPRYFDPVHGNWESCFNCGEEGHIAAHCKVEKRQRPCFVCGMFGHNAKHCVLGQDCFICKRRGHQAKDCRDKHKIAQGSVICLRCGDLGHDMASCSNNYAPCDLKEIQCYICKKYGHLCCVDYLGNGPRVVSCYNCAQTGHTGQGCAKQWGENAAAAPPALCYRCGQEGHFARGCTKSPKSAGHIGESSAHIRRLKDKKDSRGSKSVPGDFGKKHKKKSPYFEKNSGAGKSKIKGGWIVDDDPGYQPKRKLKSNAWASSPSTPSSRNYKSYSAASADRYSSPCTQSYSSPRTQSYFSPHTPQSYFSPHTPQSYSNQHAPHKGYNYYLGTPNSRGSTGGYYQRYSASRFGNPHGYYG